MNDPIDAFELQLRRLKPASPPADLPERIAKALAAAPTPIPDREPAWRAFLNRLLGPTHSTGWVLAAAAAVLVATVSAALLLSTPRPPAALVESTAARNPAAASTTSDPAPPTNARLARAATVAQAVYDDGLVRNAAGTVTQQVRYQFTDTLAWRDDQTGAEVVVSFPRMEVVSSPVRAF